MEETVTLANWQFFLLLVLAAYALLKFIATVTTYMMPRRHKPLGDGRFKLVESRRKLLEYYCNTISGFMDSIADDGGKECP